MESLSPAQWSRFFELMVVLDQAPATEVPTLLGSWEKNGESPEVLSLLKFAGRMPAPPGILAAGEKVGAKYTIMRELGRGGMGIVYEVRQDRTEQVLALKMIHPALGSAPMVAILNTEIATLGHLDHPGIVRIFDADVHRDDRRQSETPFYVMELVVGEPLTVFADQNSLDQPSRLRLFLKICDAICFAHDRNVIHGDLKPGNILVKSDGSPRVVDFGLARAVGQYWKLEMPATEEAGAMVSTIAGTPGYMAPEMFEREANANVSNVAGDVYAMGVILFELLTGKLPHPIPANQSLSEITRRVVHEPAPALGQLLPASDPELGAILERTLERRPEKRFANVGELAGAVRALLHRWDRKEASRRARPRNIRLVSYAAILLVGLTALTLWSIHERRRIASERDSSIKEQERTASDRDLQTVSQLVSSEEPGGREMALALVKRWSQRSPDPEQWRDAAISALALPEAPHSLDVPDAPAGFKPLDINRSRGVVAGIGADSKVHIVKLETPDLAAASAAGVAVEAMRLSPDGTKVLLRSTDAKLYLWNRENKAGPRSLALGAGTPGIMAFSPDSRRVAVSRAPGPFDGVIDVIDAASGQVVASLEANRRQSYPHGVESRPATDLAFSLDGRWLAAASDQSLNVLIWNVEKRSVAAQAMHSDIVLGVAWEPIAERPRLATVTRAGSLCVWPALESEHWRIWAGAADGFSLPRYLREGSAGSAVTVLRRREASWPLVDVWWHPATAEIWSLDDRGLASLWQVGQGDQPFAECHVGGEALELLPSFDAGHLDVRCVNGMLRTLPRPAAALTRRWFVPISAEADLSLCFSPGEGQLLGLRANDRLQVFCGVTLTLLAEQSVSRSGGLAFSPASGALAAGNKWGLIEWLPRDDAAAGFQAPRVLSSESSPPFAFAPQMGELALARGRTMVIKQPDEDSIFECSFEPDRLSFSKGGTYLAASSAEHKALEIWRRNEAKFEAMLLPGAVGGPQPGMLAGLFTNEADQIALHYADRFELWDVDPPQRLLSLPIEAQPHSKAGVFAVAAGHPFAALTTARGSVSLIDLKRGEEIAELRHSVARSPAAVAVSPLGDRVAFVSDDGWVVLWNVARVAAEWRPLGLAGTPPTVPQVKATAFRQFALPPSTAR